MHALVTSKSLELQSPKQGRPSSMRRKLDRRPGQRMTKAIEMMGTHS